ncbi:hypothetical protein CDL12_17884 [Handroanthus impetiginosus]|uniref:Response regulatory domain-containing protein n=1 Tax=Handroanthus impetiginosus TaxID=429701 RepID=A0A2G9GW71_9LAMI|nr:hypothetical protein CDL12_17884 [Handroanthus impetiginosus]
MVLGGLSSSSSSSFPEGLRVLLVDHDPESLKYLEKLHKKCKYEITTCNLMQEALKLLRERKDRFDIVISEFNMPDMNGFEFLQHVSLQMDIPVIIMSSDGETSRVMNVVEKGACDYLVKPIRLKELRNIWQHVLRKRVQHVRDIEHPAEIQTSRNESGQPDTILGKKRKDFENKNHDRECGDRSSVKKPRVIWSADLHQKFVKAVNLIGLDKAGPKKILELMEVPWLKRENVASHLQKYRLNLSRMQKEKELKAASGWIKRSDIFTKDVYFQHSVSQNVVTTENFVPGGLHIHDATICEGNPSAILSTPVALESNNTVFRDVIDPPISTTSGISFNQSFGPPDSKVHSQHIIQNQFTWSAKVPSIQFQQQLKPHYVIGEAADIENAAAFFWGLQGNLTFNPDSSSTWTTMNHSSEQNLHDNLLISDGFSSFVDIYAENPELLDFESSNDFQAKNLSIPVENLVIDPAHPK